ncbi:MAG: SPOR domain-containing protein [Saprospiraceae bacterium]|uniref:SPOR domain-containing protein n=1 Tax=Candidatus Opimibacter skivensis TaxID=2982028 RepID=A0A9D7SRA9_9BACT|nr:SPOR domain-containing protein [Candidatus Opimibacter skivensis]
MLIYLLSLTMGLFLGNAQPPNFYSSFSSAREASRTSQKEMVIFFGSKTCSNCEAAWSAFTKDVNGAHSYVSTRMDVEDFDGGVCFDLYELKQVPSWVILSPKGAVEEKWNGGWKDAAGNPTVFDQTAQSSAPINETKDISYTQKNPVFNANNVEKSQTGSQPPASKSSINEPPKENPSATVKNDIPKTLTSGWVIQAGYFGSEGNAQKLVSDLKSKGYSTFKIENVQKDGNTFYRVVSKTYNSESDVNGEQQRMSSKGLKGVFFFFFSL